MSNEVQLILDVWEAVRDNLPVNKRSEAAHGIMQAFFDFGFESREICGAADEDNDLEEAFYDVYHDGDHPEDDEE